MNEPPTEQLLAEIAAAFPAQVLRPSLFAEFLVIWSAYPNARSFEEGSNGQSWSALPHEFVESHASALMYMNAAAFIAVLPAYLGALVRGTENEMPAFVLGELTRRETFSAAFDARLGLMTPSQRHAIARLLDALAKTDRFAWHYRAEMAAAVETWRGLEE